MITVPDLDAAIAECQGNPHPNANTCIKLAAYLTIKQSMLKSPHEKTEDVYGLSYAPATDIVSYDSGTEFSDKINGKPINKILDLMDELMSTLQELNPKLYASVMRRL